MLENLYQIVLTEDEINTLYVLTGNSAGDCDNSPRKHSTAVYQKIKDILGIRMYELVEQKLFIGAIRFNNYPVTKTPQQLKIEELEKTINEAQKQLQELKGL